MFDEGKAYKKWCQFYCANFWATLFIVPYRLSTESKTRDLEWSWMAILRQNSVLRRYVWSSEAWLSKLGYS